MNLSKAMLIPSLFKMLVPLILHDTGVWAKKVLFVGDSNAKQFGQRLEGLCTGTELDNAGIGGSKAYEWAILPKEIVDQCSQKGEWDVVYISVGGNDIAPADGCSMNEEEQEIVLADMVTTVHNVMTSIAPGAKTYFMTGYCLPPTAGPGANPKGCDFTPLPSDLANGMLGKLPELITPPDGATFTLIDSKYACGASESSWSDELYFRSDLAHLSMAGYCKVFRQPEIQEILSCENTDQEIDCDSLSIPFDMMLMDENCADEELRNDITSTSSSPSISKSHLLMFLTVKVTLIITYIMG